MLFEKMLSRYPVARLVGLFVIVTLGIVLLGAYLYQNHKEWRRDYAEEILSGVAVNKVAQVVSWQNARLADGLASMQNPFLVAAISQFLSEPADQSLRGKLQQWMQAQVQNRGYKQIYLIGADQKSKLEFPPGSVELNEQSASAAAEAFRLGEPCFSEIYQSLSGEVLNLDLAVPISPYADGNSLPIAVLLYRMEPQAFILPLIGEWASHSLRVQTILGMKAGESVLYMKEVGGVDGATLGLRVADMSNDVLAQRALRGEEGIFQGEDLSGVSFLSDLHLIPQSKWFLLTKANLDEIYAPLRTDIDLFLVLAVATISVFIFAIALHERQRKVVILSSLLSVERERNEILEKLQANQNKLAAVIDAIGDGVVVTDVDGRVVLMNAEAERLCHCVQKEWLGKEIEEVLPLFRGDTKEPLENPIRIALRTGRVAGMITDTTLVIAGAAPLIVADKAAVVKDSKGEYFCAVMVFRDVTLERRMQIQLQNMARLEALGVMAGGIAHDFNNMLTTISGSVGLVRRAVEQSNFGKTNQYLEQIERAAMLASGVTQQLLTFAKGVSPVRRLLNLEELVREATTMAMAGSAHRCRFDISTVPPVMGDKGQLIQVVHNLVLNANQAMINPGEIVIGMELVSASEVVGMRPSDGDFVKTWVKDSGIGIQPSLLPRIFDPFFTTKPTGKGLGLSSAFSIINAHGGYLRVESVLEQGTTFTFYLPAAQGIEVDAQPPMVTTVHNSKRNILIMDDEPGIRDILREIISNMGHSVVAVADGEMAIQAYSEALNEKNPFDFVILDITIPGGMGGKDVLSELLKIDPAVRAICSSGFSTEPIMEKFSDYGFMAVLPKPYSVTAVEELVHKFAG